MGEVYLVDDLRLNHQVALKFLPLFDWTLIRPVHTGSDKDLSKGPLLGRYGELVPPCRSSTSHQFFKCHHERVIQSECRGCHDL